MGIMRNAYKILAVKCEQKKTLGRCSRRYKDNIKIDFKKVGFEDVD
jgi:hypothetical protein